MPVTKNISKKGGQQRRGGMCKRGICRLPQCSSRLLGNMRQRMRELEEENAGLRRIMRESEDVQMQGLKDMQLRNFECKFDMLEANIKFLKDSLAIANSNLVGSDEHTHKLQQTVCSLRKQLFDKEVALQSALSDAAREAHNCNAVRQKLSLTCADLRQSVESMKASVTSIPTLARRAEILDAVMSCIRGLKECVQGMQEGLADGITLSTEEGPQYMLPCGHVLCEVSLEDMLKMCRRNDAYGIDDHQKRCPQVCPFCRKSFSRKERAVRVRMVEEAIKHLSSLENKLDDIVLLNVPK